MAWKPYAAHAWDALRHLFEILGPGAIGSAVGQFWERGISLKQRLVQWAVGLACAVLIVPGLGHAFSWDQPIVNAVGFVVGTLAFKAVPQLRDAFIDGASGSLRSLPEVFQSWTKKPGASAEPTDLPPPEGEG